MILLIIALFLAPALCVVPSGQLSIRYAYKTVDFSIAHFGGQFTQIGYSSYSRLIYPSSDAKGCGKITTPYVSHSMPFVLILERGECSFYSKAQNAQDAGAAAVLIYNSMEGIYSEKAYADSRDYDCENGEGWVGHSTVKGMTKSDVYGSKMTSSIPSSCSSSRRCESEMCVYTNVTNSGGDQKACCAWDLYMSMGSEAGKPSLSIPIGFLRMQDYRSLTSYKSYSLNIMEVAVYEKSVFWSWSAFLVWSIAVITVALGAILAAEEDKLFIYTRGRGKGEIAREDDYDEETVASAPSIRRVTKSRSSSKKQGGPITERTGLLSELDEAKPVPTGSRSSPSPWFDFRLPSFFSFSKGDKDRDGGDSGSVSSSVLDDVLEEQSVMSVRSGASEFFLRVKGHVVHAAEHIMNSDEGERDDPAVELDPVAALAFILASSAFLVTLYYIDIFSYVSIVYLLAAAYAVHICCFEPLLGQCRRGLYYALFVYDWRYLPQDAQECCQVMCLECFDDLRTSNLPLMNVDREDAIYDEETGEIITDSNLNHNSRFYLDPHLARDIAERDERSRRQRELIRARAPDLPDSFGRLADADGVNNNDGDSMQSGGSGRHLSSRSSDIDAQAQMGLGVCVLCAGSTPSATGYTRLLAVASVALSMTVPVLWYLFPTSSFRWLLQDLMGASVCIFFLQAVRVPSLKVATALLCFAFVYDVFFVFISPLVFGTSVMMSVASGGSVDDSSPLSTDENFCEKYPDYKECAITNVPMLMYIPAFWTWDTNANSMLGLGDIVLPGLLLVWTARYDLRRYGSLSCEKAGDGYFPMAMAGYAFGLCLAQLAVEIFNYGQPALLYIVPCVLAPVLYRSNRSGTLPLLWEALPPMKSIGLPLDAEAQEKIATEDDVFNTTAMWPAANGGAGGGLGGDRDGDGGSVHSLHGYDLDGSRRVRSRDTAALDRR